MDLFRSLIETRLGDFPDVEPSEIQLERLFEYNSPEVAIQYYALEQTLAGLSASQIAVRCRLFIEKEHPSLMFSAHIFADLILDIGEKYFRYEKFVDAQRRGLKYAIYQGGLKRDTRPFCCVREGKVFSLEEILRFGTDEDDWKAYASNYTENLQNDLIANGGYWSEGDSDFSGKPWSDYNPIIDLGGKNCRHDLGLDIRGISKKYKAKFVLDSYEDRSMELSRCFQEKERSRIKAQT